MLRSISFEAKSNDPNPIAVESPQKQIALPTPFQTFPKSPTLRRRENMRWML